MARWNFPHRQHLKFPTFNLYTVPAKILYLQRYSTDFRKRLLQLEDVEGGHLGGKFQVRRYFNFAMARWKLCASTTFEISYFQPVHCAGKNPISPKVFNRFSKRFFISKMLRVAIWVESFRCRGILLLQWQGENFAHRQHLKFPTFNLYTVPAKILYLQRYSTDFRKLCFNSKMLRVGIWVESFRCAGILLLHPMARWKPCAASTTFEISHFQPVQLCHC